ASASRRAKTENPATKTERAPSGSGSDLGLATAIPLDCREKTSGPGQQRSALASIAYHARGDSSDDGIGFDVVGHHRTHADDRVSADGDAVGDAGARANPDVFARANAARGDGLRGDGARRLHAVIEGVQLGV